MLHTLPRPRSGLGLNELLGRRQRAAWISKGERPSTESCNLWIRLLDVLLRCISPTKVCRRSESDHVSARGFTEEQTFLVPAKLGSFVPEDSCEMTGSSASNLHATFVHDQLAANQTSEHDLLCAIWRSSDTR